MCLGPLRAFALQHILDTVLYGEGLIMVWACGSYDCKLDLNLEQCKLS